MNYMKPKIDVIGRASKLVETKTVPHADFTVPLDIRSLSNLLDHD